MSRNLTNTISMLNDLKTQFAPKPESPLNDKAYGSIKRANRQPRTRNLEEDVAELMCRIDIIFDQASSRQSGHDL